VVDRRSLAGPPATAKSAYLALAEAELSAFLSERTRLVLPAHDEPRVSVIVVLHNRAALTYACLQSIRH
jgi:hypothetical protein